MKQRILILFSLFIVLSYTAYAQKETWNWVFGEKGGLTWNQLRPFAATGINGTPNATLNDLPETFSSNMSNLEGIFSMSDRNGNLLFFSNGMTIWNADSIPIFTDLEGHDSSAQSGIVVSYPGNPKKFICIGLGEKDANNMGYVIVQANSPTDVSVIGSRVAFTGHTGILGESMSAVRHSNGKDWWIVAPGKGASMSLNAWLATSSGIQTSTPVLSATNINVKASTSNGYFKFTPDAKHFAWGTWMDDKLIVGNFNNTTGSFSNISSINRGSYGVEFSTNMKYLYTSTPNGTTSNVGWYVWDFNALLNKTTTTSLKYISGFTHPAAMQMDPVGRIWGTDYYQPKGSLYVIDNPDEPENLRTYRLDNFLASGTYGQMGLSSFSASFFYLEGDNVFCVNTLKEFTAIIPTIIDTKTVAYTKWSFGDGSEFTTVAGSGEQIESHTYLRSGYYTITVLAYNSEDEQLGSPQTMEVKVSPCVIPVNPNVHLSR